MFDPVVVHCEDIPDIKFKLPEPSILNCAVLYFNVIVFDVFKNGLLKVKYFVYLIRLNLLYLMSHLHKILKGTPINQ